MKNFIKDGIIILVIIIVISSLIGATQSSSNEQKQESVQSEIYILEGNIDSSYVIKDGNLNNEDKESSKGNTFSKIGETISLIFINLITKIVEFITTVIYKIMS